MTGIEITGLIRDIEDLARQKAKGQILTVLTDLHPADIADLLDRLPKKRRRYLFEPLDTEVASDVILEVDEASGESLLEEIDRQCLSDHVDEMDSDDAADIVSELPTNVAAIVLVRSEE